MADYPRSTRSHFLTFSPKETVITMAGRKRTTRKDEYKWLGHVNLAFTEKQIAECLAYCADRKWDFVDDLCTLTQQDWGVKLTYDNQNDCYRCTLQPKAKECYLRGYTIGFNHVEMPRILQIASYVVNELVEHQGVEIPGKAVAPSW